MQTTRDEFVRLAPFYDFVTLPIRGLRHRVVELAAPPPGARILDVATGTGAQAFAFAAAGAGEVVGVDLSPAMLAIARRRNRFGSVSFLEADAAALPCPDASFDLACISFGLHEMPADTRRAAVREMARVTRPSGSIVVVDYVLPRNALAAALVDRLVGLYEGEHYAGFVRSDLREMLEAGGVVVTAEHLAVLGAVRIMIGVVPRRGR